MDVYYYYNYLSASWMALEALPMLTSPTLVVALLSPEIREITSLESYLSRTLGLTLLTIAGLTLLLTGSIPLTTSLSEATTGVDTDLEDPTAPYVVPTLCLTLAYHAAVAFYCYSMWIVGYSLAFALGCVVSGLIVAVGGWCLLFATSSGHISSKTGADKRTSGFPFKNNEADKKRKRL